MKTLARIYKDLNLDWTILSFLKGKFLNMMDCPCIKKEHCLHDILPKKKEVGGGMCNLCPLSKAWQQFKNDYYDLIYKHMS